MKRLLVLLLISGCARATLPSVNDELETAPGAAGAATAIVGGGAATVPGRGGSTSVSGGQASTGGRTASGGHGGAGGESARGGVGPGGCVLGETMSCAAVQPQFPKGTTTCGRDGFPTTTCHLCETGDTIDCGAIPGNDAAPFGKTSCDPIAGFGKGDWLRDDCQICEPGVTHIDCLKIEGGNYTGGQAVCNLAGDGWLGATCAVCGDGSKNGELEQCDGADVTPTTCGALDFGGGDPAAPVSACAANCNYDTSQCGHCAGGVGAGDCMESGACTGPACDNKGCARDGNCQFLCRDNAASKCHYAVCSERATCRFDCYNQGGCLGPECRAGASCQFGCQNKLGECRDIACEDGAKCDFTCSDGGTCSTSQTVHCKAADDCNVACTNGGNCKDLSMVCEKGSICQLQMNNAASVPSVECESGATCHLHCLGTNCSSIKCSGSGCKCDEGSCPGFQ